MKRLVFAGLITATIFACESSQKDSVKVAHEQNVNSAIDEEISKFMTEAADLRMMLVEQGKLGATKATSPALKQFSQELVSKQSDILQTMRMLAGQKNVLLPNTLSNKKADDLEDLKEKEGADFDKEFLDLLQRYYKDDVDLFEDATDLRDRDVKLFAETNLPLVESSFTRIKELEETVQQQTAEGEKE